MVTPIGPLFAGGNQLVTKSGYRINYWTDAHNIELQRTGQSPVYYWLPEGVRLIRKANGNLAFSFIHFSGIRSSSTTIGEIGDGSEVAGAMLTFSTMTAPPDDVLAEAHATLKEQVRNEANQIWHWNGVRDPSFTFIPIVSNNCTLSNTLPGADGSVSGPAQPPRGKALNPHAPRGIIRQSPSDIMLRSMPRTVPLRGVSRSNIDPMLVHMDGTGPGPINPFVAKPYGALLGSIPSAVAYAGFHDTGTGPIFVTQNMDVRVVSPVMTIDIMGDWSRIQEFYSGAVSASGFFWDVDIKSTFESMRTQGIVEVHTFVDESLPGAKEMKEYMDKRSDLVYQKFSEMAKQTIFDPVPFTEKPAEAQQGGGGFLTSFFGGAGAAFKMRKQRISLHLDYHETREIAYIQPYQVGGTLDGVADDIRADPAKDKVYFTKVDLGDWDRKIVRVAKPVINWANPETKWVGEPVAFVDVQFAYPNAEGALQWDGHVFNQGEGPSTQWNTAVAMKKEEEVTNPPPGWKPDKLYMKRVIHFTEPPSPLENPYARIQVETNSVDLDPGEYGTLDDRIAVEVRAESAGALAVGPVNLGINLTDDTQVIEVTLRALGKRLDGKDRDPVKFTYKNADQNEPRYWMVYTGQPDFEPKFEYSVRVIVKGTLFSDGMEWEHKQPIQTGGSGGLTISVPKQNSPDVTTRAVPLYAYRKAIGEEPVAAPPPAGHVPTPPPPTPTGPSHVPPATPIHAPPATGHAPPATPRPGVPSGVSGKPSTSRPPARGASGQKGKGAGMGNGQPVQPNGSDVVFTSLEPT